jgi:Bacterial protein of unknown function (DUF916)
VRLRLQGLLAIGATVGVLGSFGAPAWAQNPGGFGAAPANPNSADPATRAYFKPVIAPAGTKTDQVRVTSTSDQPIYLYVSAVDGLTGQTSGAVYANRQDPVKKAGAWVTPSISSLTLAPHSQQLVDFTVTVPSNATPGDHLAGIAIENANPTTSRSQFGVREIIRTVVGVDIEVPGPAKPHIHLGLLALGALPGLHFATLTIHIGDDGLKLVKPLLNVTFDGPSHYHRALVRRLDTILPGDTIAYPFGWPDDLAAGDYHVAVIATNGSEREVITATLHLGAKLPGTNKQPVIVASTGTSSLSLAAILALVFAMVAITLFVGFRFGTRRSARQVL